MTSTGKTGHPTKQDGREKTTSSPTNGSGSQGSKPKGPIATVAETLKEQDKKGSQKGVRSSPAAAGSDATQASKTSAERIKASGKAEDKAPQASQKTEPKQGLFGKPSSQSEKSSGPVPPPSLLARKTKSSSHKNSPLFTPTVAPMPRKKESQFEAKNDAETKVEVEPNGKSGNDKPSNDRTWGGKPIDDERKSESGQPETKSVGARRPVRSRKARLRLTRIDPWSVMKTAFLLSIAIGVMMFVAVTVLWSVLDAAGVFASLDRIITDMTSSDAGAGLDITQYIELSRVLGVTTLIAVVDVLLLTALATLGAFLYNLSASLLGGVELTLQEDE